MIPAPRIARLTIYPIKSMDGVSVESAPLFAGGGLWGDRLWAILDSEGEVINGKNTPAIFRLRATFAPELSTVRFGGAAGEGAEFSLTEVRSGGQNPRLNQFLSDYFGKSVVVRSNETTGFPDYESNPGPSLVSTASLAEFCRWFPEVSLDEARRRFRTTVEIDGVPPFWEDGLFAAKDEPRRFRLGDVEVWGMGPIMRCPVPTRDSRTGDVMRGFQRRFILARRQQLEGSKPLHGDRLEEGYYMAIKTRVPDAAGKVLRVGDLLKD